MSSIRAWPSDKWKIISVNPTINGYPFRIREVKGREKRLGSAFHMLCPRSGGLLALTATRATRLWETFTICRCLNTKVRKGEGVRVYQACVFHEYPQGFDHYLES